MKLSAVLAVAGLALAASVHSVAAKTVAFEFVADGSAPDGYGPDALWFEEYDAGSRRLSFTSFPNSVPSRFLKSTSEKSAIRLPPSRT